MSFFDMFGPLFDPSEGANRSDRQRSSNDDPIILNVETDGDTTSRSGSSVPPKGPSRPRIARRPNRPRKGASRGNKILIGIVLALSLIHI